jgi:hypothetical protein
MIRFRTLPITAITLATAALGTFGPATVAAQDAPFTMEQVKSYPFPTELAASPSGARIAWALNEEGRRNLYVAEGPDWHGAAA